MSAQLPIDLAGAIRSRWPRLMDLDEACEYLSIGRQLLEQHGPAKVAVGRRRLYDRAALDRWCDGLSGRPVDAGEPESHASEVERNFLERRGKPPRP